MLLCLAIESFFIDEAIIQEQEDWLYTPKILSNCYGRNNVLIADIDNGRLCIQFDIQFNDECLPLPPGIYIDIQLSNYPDQIIRGQFKNFSYKNDQYLCYSCPILGTDTKCQFIQQTEAAAVQIKSLTWETTLPVGKISIDHAVFSNCYDSTLSQMFWSDTEAKLELIQTSLCPFFGVDFYSYTFLLRRIDGTIDEIIINTINEAGDKVITETLNTGYKQVDILHDFSTYYLNSYNDINIVMKVKLENILVTQTTSISLLQSYDLPVMYQNAVFTVWAQRFSLQADPLENADFLQEEFGSKTIRMRQRYEVFNKQTGETMANLFFEGTTFDFTNIDRGILCDDNSDGGACSKLLILLQSYDLQQVELLFHYYFYDIDGNMILYASSLVPDTQNTCWTGVETDYYQDIVCGVFTSNAGATSCPYLQPTLINFTIEFSDYKMSSSQLYSVEDSEVCVQCPDLRCIQIISQMFKQKSSVSFTFQSGEDEFNLVSVSNYNENYSPLHERIFYCFLVIFGLLVVVIVVYILKLLGKIGGRKVVGKATNADVEDEL